jgi:histone H3/H4
VKQLVKDFPLSPLEKIMRKAGAERVAVSALKEMKIILLEIAEKIAIEAVAASHHAKRVTVKREDIAMAIR